MDFFTDADNLNWCGLSFCQTLSTKRVLFCCVYVRLFVCLLNRTPSSTSDGPHDFMVQLVQYLETTLAIMPSLPRTTLDAIFYTSCRQIAALMMVRANLSFLCIGLFLAFSFPLFSLRN